MQLFLRLFKIIPQTYLFFLPAACVFGISEYKKTKKKAPQNRKRNDNDEFSFQGNGPKSVKNMSENGMD
jgi:hypothetical protein